MGTRQKYETYLEQNRQEEKSTAELGKRKRILEEVDELKKKKKKVEAEVTDLISAGGELYDKAETTGKMTFVTQANSLRRTATDKQQEIDQRKNSLDALNQNKRAMMALYRSTD